MVGVETSYNDVAKIAWDMTIQDIPPAERTIAYFSMEIGFHPDVPTYSGGLGMLAGDTIRSAADLQVPMVAVTLLHRKGYFFQRLDDSGWQSEQAVRWVIGDFLEDVGRAERAC